MDADISAYQSVATIVEERPATDYAWSAFRIGPGGEYVVDALRKGDTEPLETVIQDFLYRHPEVGELLNDRVEEWFAKGWLVDPGELPESVRKEMEEKPRVHIQFLDAPWSHSTWIEEGDLANYHKEIEDIAMTLKAARVDSPTHTVKPDVFETTINSMYHLAGKAERMATCFVGGAFFGAGASIITGPFLQSAVVGGMLGLVFWLYHH